MSATDDTNATSRGSGSNDLLGLAPERESVDDALLIVESYGPWGADLNDAHRRQIVLADEVVRLRKLYEMAARGRAEMRSALRQERRAEELHEGCQMPMEQARDGLHDDGDLRGVAGPLPERGWDNAEA